jgi:hypothetical protein
MGGILDSIFGSSKNQNQTTSPDATSRAMNNMRLQEMQRMFGSNSLSDYANSGGEAYDPSNYVSDALRNQDSYDSQWTRNNGMTFNDYRDTGYRENDRTYNRANADVDSAAEDAYARNTSNYNDLFNRNASTYNDMYGRNASNYEDMYGRNTSNYNDIYNTNKGTYEDTYGRNRSNYDEQTARNQGFYEDTYARNRSNNEEIYNRNKSDYSGVSAKNEQMLKDSLGLSDANYDQLKKEMSSAFEGNYKKALDTTSNYISQVASPQAKQAMALQGMEGGGALPAAISKATAEAGLPLMEALLPQYQSEVGQSGRQHMSEQTALEQAGMAQEGETGRQYMGQQGALGSQYAGTQAAAASQNMANQANAASQYSGTQAAASDRYGSNQAAMGNQYMANQAAMSGQHMANQAASNQAYANMQGAMGGQYMGAQSGVASQRMGARAAIGQQGMADTSRFTESLPGAADTITMTPEKAAMARAQRANTMMPLYDYQRSLKEQDYLRRQGVVGTAMTGMPYTPGSSSKGGTSAAPLFGWFGQG